MAPTQVYAVPIQNGMACSFVRLAFSGIGVPELCAHHLFTYTRLDSFDPHSEATIATIKAILWRAHPLISVPPPGRFLVFAGTAS